jgi:hypothetical protein
LIKGLSIRLNIPSSLSKELAPTSRKILAADTEQGVVSDKKAVKLKDIIRLSKTYPISMSMSMTMHHSC